MNYSSITHKCPNCGGPLMFDTQTQQLKCNNCLSIFKSSEIRKIYNKTDNTELQNSDIICNSCGGIISNHEDVISGFCPYCNNPVIERKKATGINKPDYIIPFKITEAEAIQTFNDYIYISKSFSKKNKNKAIKNLTKIYVPYWLFDFKTKVFMRYKNENDGHLIRKDGIIKLNKIPAEASENIPNVITEKIEPYFFNDAIPFERSILQGAFAEKITSKMSAVIDTAKTRSNFIIDNYIQNTSEDSIVLQSDKENTFLTSDYHYALCPIYLISVIGKNKRVYKFVVNGQTGKCAMFSDKNKVVRVTNEDTNMSFFKTLISVFNFHIILSIYFFTLFALMFFVPGIADKIGFILGVSIILFTILFMLTYPISLLIQRRKQEKFSHLIVYDKSINIFTDNNDIEKTYHEINDIHKFIDHENTKIITI